MLARFVQDGRHVARVATVSIHTRDRAEAGSLVAGDMSRGTSPRGREPAVFVPPMQALGVRSVPPGDWSCEIKLDGFRALAVVQDRRVAVWSRNENRLDGEFPEVVAALQKLRCRSAVVDGEIVALDEAGRSSFQLLQGRNEGPRPPVVFIGFDLLHLDGHSTVALPLERRQELLAELLHEAPPGLQVSPHFDVGPGELLKAARQNGLEGIVAKRRGSPYEPGRRSGAWLKCKVHSEQEFVIGGLTPPQGQRPFFGALLVGYFEGGVLCYAGRVGTGFTYRTLEHLHRAALARQRATSPFAPGRRGQTGRAPSGATRNGRPGITWVEPALVAQIRFAEWTEDGLLRQPVFLGLRGDKRAREVVREAPAAE